MNVRKEYVLYKPILKIEGKQRGLQCPNFIVQKQRNLGIHFLKEFDAFGVYEIGCHELLERRLLCVVHEGFHA